MRILTAFITAVALVGVGMVRSASIGPTAGESLAVHLRRERTRLQAHFDSVDLELRSRNQRALSTTQRAARGDLVEWLREYRDAGRFPLNQHYPGRVTPIFRDHRGVLCAMAYLIERSGRHDLVDRIAQGQNTARIADLGGNADLSRWLDSVGLDPAEAARIQPTYSPPPGTVYASDAVSSGFAVTSLLWGGASVATTTLNLVKPTKTTGWMGLLVGSGAIVIGLDRLDGSRATKQVAVVDIALGGATVYFGLRTLLRPKGKKRGTEQPGDTRLGRFDLAMQPIFVTATDRPRLGLMLSARF